MWCSFLKLEIFWSNSWVQRQHSHGVAFPFYCWDQNWIIALPASCSEFPIRSTMELRCYSHSIKRRVLSQKCHTSFGDCFPSTQASSCGCLNLSLAKFLHVIDFHISLSPSKKYQHRNYNRLEDVELGLLQHTYQ